MGNSIGEMNSDNYSISPNYRVRDWIVARNNNNWEKMINIFYDRIESRFLKPIRLISSDKRIGEFTGFSILAIDCLVIETLNQFYSGTNETVGEHRKAFWNFFRASDFFKKEFSRKKAFTFYSHFRCGILHQAQTKPKSLVRINQKEMVQTVGNNISDGLIVDRSRFHLALEGEIKSYIQRLQNGEAVLRNNFISKMNIICNLP